MSGQDASLTKTSAAVGAIRHIGPATLYLGECQDVLPTLADKGHVITDPPYEDEAHNKGRRLLGKQEGGQRTVEYGALDFDALTPKQRAAYALAMVGCCDGWLLAFCQAEAVADWRRDLTAAGARYLRAMVWLKPDGAPQFTGDRPGMGYESIVAAWNGAGRSRWNGGGRHGVFSHAHRDNNHPKQHMTQKPLALMCELVALFTDPGNLVIDPFMGSGTTGVAAIQHGRQFVGIERTEKHFLTACGRIERAVAQGTLFAAAPAPIQLDLEAA